MLLAYYYYLFINVLYTRIYSAHPFPFSYRPLQLHGQKQNEHMTFFGKVAGVFLQEKLHVPKQRGHLLCSHFGPTAKRQIPPPPVLGEESCCTQ